MSESNQFVVVAIVAAMVFLPLAMSIATSERPYNPHSPYWKAKSRRRGR